MMTEEDFKLFEERAHGGLKFTTLAQRRGLSTARIQQRFSRICRILIATYELHNSTCHQRAKKAFVEERNTNVAPTQVNEFSPMINDLDLSVRSYNALWHSGIETLDDLSRKSVDDLMRLKNCGLVSVVEICVQAKEWGIVLPMGKIGPKVRARVAAACGLPQDIDLGSL